MTTERVVARFLANPMSHLSKPVTILPYRREGAWEFNGGLRKQAVCALELAEEVSADLRRQWEEARARQLGGEKVTGRLVSDERIAWAWFRRSRGSSRHVAAFDWTTTQRSSQSLVPSLRLATS